MEDPKKTKTEEAAKKPANFAKVPLTLVDAVVKYIMNSKSDFPTGTSVQILTQLQKCEKI